MNTKGELIPQYTEAELKAAATENMNTLMDVLKEHVFRERPVPPLNVQQMIHAILSQVVIDYRVPYSSKVVAARHPNLSPLEKDSGCVIVPVKAMLEETSSPAVKAEMAVACVSPDSKAVVTVKPTRWMQVRRCFGVPYRLRFNSVKKRVIAESEQLIAEYPSKEDRAYFRGVAQCTDVDEFDPVFGRRLAVLRVVEKALRYDMVRLTEIRRSVRRKLKQTRTAILALMNRKYPRHTPILAILYSPESRLQRSRDMVRAMAAVFESELPVKTQRKALRKALDALEREWDL